MDPVVNLGRNLPDKRQPASPLSPTTQVKLLPESVSQAAATFAQGNAFILYHNLTLILVYRGVSDEGGTGIKVSACGAEWMLEPFIKLGTLEKISVWNERY